MDDPSIEFIAAIVTGVLVGALFSGVDAAVNALNDARLNAIAETKGRAAALAKRVVKDRRGISARLLTGRVLCVAFSASLAGYIGLGQGSWMRAAAGVALVAYVYATIATIVTTIARRRASRVALHILYWIRPLEWLLWPFAAPLILLSALIARLVPEAPSGDAEELTELVVEHVIEEGEETGSIAQDHAQLLRSVLEFKNTVTREVMVPRTQVVAFEISTPIDEVRKRIIESEHSRYPVYRGQIDQVEGVLYAKDMFRLLQDGTSSDGIRLDDILRKPVFFAAEAQKIGSLLREMQARRTHLAVVVDEFGGASGIVTLEDILEEIVGEIQDEYDQEAPRITQPAPGHYIADASMSVYDLEEMLGESICEKGDFDTLGGMLVELCGRVPVVGEKIRAANFDIGVLQGDERHVKRVELVRRAEQAGDSDPAHALSG